MKKQGNLGFATCKNLKFETVIENSFNFFQKFAIIPRLVSPKPFKTLIFVKYFIDKTFYWMRTRFFRKTPATFLS